MDNVPRLVLGVFSGILYLLSNCIADIILLYRCYVVWGSAKRALTGVLLLVLSTTNVFGLVAHVLVFVSRGKQRWDLSAKTGSIIMAYNMANAANTIIMTLLIAGRLWWITRDAREFMGHKVDRRYKRIVSTLIESGFLYSAVLIVNSCLTLTSSNLGYRISLNSLVRLMVGIAPTLIFLRTSLASTDNAVPNSRMLSTLRFGDPPAAVSSEGHVRSVALQQASTDENSDVETQKVERSDTSSA
ncbi:hypothetical protein VNI00_010427 [Paramarasmius palmivorus]|uniref:Uncharacterized protein n=1 Tax=Paramarasmius palmivorus TaxID=297713 RepID=A0AAW0CH54_9AGAR